MITLNDLQKIYDVLLSGNISVITDVNIQLSVTEYATYLINKHPWDQEEQMCADLILKISNTAYNTDIFFTNMILHIFSLFQILTISFNFCCNFLPI